MKNLRNVYFRLDSNYVWGKGMDEKDFLAFEKEAEEIIKFMGFNLLKRKYANGCPQGILNEENIYAHPMSFSGIMSLENVGKMTEFLNSFKSSTFYVRAIDVYDLEERHNEKIQDNLKTQEQLE